MKTVSYVLSENIPVIAETDVLVIGGGPGGVAAAVMAARQGVRVVMAERFGAPGGAANISEVTPFMSNHIDNATLDAPIYVEWNRRMGEYSGASGKFNENVEQNVPLSPVFAMLAAEDMLNDAGVKQLYHHTFFDVVKNGEKIESVIFHGKSGLCAVKAHTVIDSTGDGDAAVAAGCRFEQGNSTGLCQPMTLCFKVSGVDKSKMPSREEINGIYDREKKAGRLDCPRENLLWFPAVDDDVIHLNTTRVILKNGTNAQDLSDAEQEGRRQLREVFKFLRRCVPGFENARIRSAAFHIGVRETRRITGDIYQTEDDFVNAAKYDDCIARNRYHIDIHNPSGAGTTIKRLPEGQWYEISYRALATADCSNLLMGCRAISVDHGLFSSIRIMPSVCSLGQAAGMAAAMCVQKNCSVHEIDGREVRKNLVKAGAKLN